MERIKQAIEKAKGQQLYRTVGPVQEHPQRDITNDRVNSDVVDALEHIKYTRTKVIKLRMDHLEKNRIVALDKINLNSMVFDRLRTQVLQMMDENGWRTLAITSPTSEAGKTVVAINLAMSISQQTNKTALLVDFDFRRPKIGYYLGLPMERSLNDFLGGAAELADVLVNPDIPRMVVLATKSPVKKSSETLSSKKISDLIKELRERYESRIVIFDLPPVLVADDAIALLPQIDCVLMVVANGMSTKSEIEACKRHIPKERLLGAILNKAENVLTDYYY